MTRNTAQSATYSSRRQFHRLKFFTIAPEEEATVMTPAVNGSGVCHQAAEVRPLPTAVLAERQQPPGAVHKGPWKPGTFGFGDSDAGVAVVKDDTFPMMVLTGIAKEQGEQKPVMQSEISGAAGNAGIVGIGNVISVVLKYIAVFLIQYGFGPALYGLYTL